MRTPGAALLLALALMGVAAREARAHGGSFRIGNPAPSPEQGAPAPPLPGAPGAVTPGAGVLPGSSARTGGRPWEPRTSPLVLFEWPVWWALNTDTLLPPRQPPRALRLAPVTPSATGRVLPAELVARIRWRRRVDETSRRLAVPFLLELLDASRRPSDELLGAALIALARSVRDATALPYLRRHAFDRRGGDEVRECAVIGMGLARRSRSGEQLSLAELNGLRRDLMLLFDDAENPLQLRAFAAYSLALLADQPYGAECLERYGRDVTRWMQIQLRDRHLDDELAGALLTALGHQPAQGVPTEILEDLEDLVIRRYGFGRTWERELAAQAVQALARLGAPQTERVAGVLLRTRKTPEAVQGAACTALALRARTLPPEGRVRIAERLRRDVSHLRRSRVQRVALLALGAVLDDDLAAGSEAVLVESDVVSFLRAELRHGATMDRPYAALALGLAVRHATPVSRPRLVFATETRRALARGLETARGSDEVLAAYAAAVGLARADEARPLLLEILGDRHRHHVLRGHAAIALAAFGHRDRAVATALLDASRERMHPWVHVQAVRALAILGIAGSADDLLAQIETTPSAGARVAVAASLGQLGDPEAAERMIGLVRDTGAPEGVRISAVVGLGLLFDREERPSRTKLTEHQAATALTGSLSRYIDVR